MDDEQRYQRARSRVDQLKGFYSHLTVFIIVNLFLFLLNFFSGGEWWFYWPLLGWGIGIIAHALSVFVGSGRLTQDWEDRKIRELMEQDRDQR